MSDKLPTTDQREHDRLLGAFLDGDITDADFAKLNEALRQNAALRAALVNSSIQAVMMREQAGTEAEAAHLPTTRAAHARWRGWAWAAAIVLLLIPGALVVNLMMQREDGPNRQQATAQAEAGRLVSSREAQWDGAMAEDDGRIVMHQPLRLRSGSAVLETIHGVQLLLSGKAEMVMTDAALAELQQGQLAVDVPKRSGDEADGGGYTVVTPNARVVSLSTAFGVEVTDDGETQVHVFEGKVHVVDLDADAAPRPVGKTVAHGEAVRVGRGGVVAVAHEPSRFTPAEPSKRLNVGADYVAAVLDKEPLAYWRFETTARGLIRNEASDRHHAWPVGGLTSDGPAGSRVGRFNAPVGERYLFVDERLTGLVGSDYTIELWVKPEQRQHATLINLSGNAEAFDAEALEHAVVIELWPDDRGVRFLHRSPAGHSGGTDVFSNEPYPLNVWQHVVATKAGGRMMVYLNGELAAEGRDETTMPVDPFVSIGRLTLPREQDQSRRNIVGSMSDVAVYDRALSASEIQQHYQLIHRAQQTEGDQ